MRSGIQPLRRALAGDPLGGGVALLDGHRVAGLGRVGVLDEGQGGVGADRQLAYEPVVGAGVAEHPAAAVHVDDGRQATLGAFRLDDPHAGVAYGGGHGDPFLVDRQLLDRPGLKVVEDLARLGILHFVDVQRF